jgi:hypothetical protein
MNATDTFSIAPDVMAQEVGDEIVILDLRSGTYFGLDPVGARIWRHAEAGKSLDGICEELLAEFDVSGADARRDAAELLEQLVARALIVRQGV